jgi:hypothetical protein
MFDVKSLAIRDTFVLHLKHPVTEDNLYADEAKKQPITITLSSTASKAYRKFVNAMHERAIKRGVKKQSAEEKRAEGVELLVAVCISSENLVYNKQPVQTEADFRALLSDDTVSWIKEQVDNALGDKELFIG